MLLVVLCNHLCNVHLAKELWVMQGCDYSLQDVSVKLLHGYNNNKTKHSHTQLDSRKQVVAFQDRVTTTNIKEAQHPLK